MNIIIKHNSMSTKLIYLAVGLAIVFGSTLLVAKPAQAQIGGYRSAPGTNDTPAGCYTPSRPGVGVILETVCPDDNNSTESGAATAYPSSNSSSGSNSSANLMKMIESLQKRVAALTKLVQQKNAAKIAARGTAGATPAKITKNIGVGSKGAQVTSLQQCLVNLGYFKKADMDPTYGPKTRQAVKQFQAAEGIASSGNEWSTGYGYVGPKTRNKLNNKCGSANTAASGNSSSNSAYTIKDVSSVTRESQPCYQEAETSRVSIACQGEGCPPKPPMCSVLNITLKDGDTRSVNIGVRQQTRDSASQIKSAIKASGYSGDYLDIFAKVPPAGSPGSGVYMISN